MQSGLLPIDKPAGMISKDVSRWLVKRAGKLKLGHVGTLDPGASGVLPLLIGKATRLQDLLLDLPKTYEFDVKLGSETDTLDQDGQVVREAPWEHVTEEALRTAVARFIGEVEQTPPIYSAVKYKGKPLYEYARGGAEADVPLEGLKRKVFVSTFELLTFAPGRASFRATCSRGTYVRTLVKDVADAVGSCGTLTRLVRTQAAGIHIENAIGLDALEKSLPNLGGALIPMESIDLGMPRWQAQGNGWMERLSGGQQIAVEPAEYLDGLKSETERDLPAAWSRNVLLLGREGRAFGFGNVRRNESGRVVISMKRGL